MSEAALETAEGGLRLRGACSADRRLARPEKVCSQKGPTGKCPEWEGGRIPHRQAIIRKRGPVAQLVRAADS